MKTLCWVRRDLRLHDHVALSYALSQGETTMVFIFDSLLLKQFKHKQDRRITFIYQCLVEMEKALQKHGSSLIIRYGKPEEEIVQLAQELEVDQVCANRDYEPYAKERDKRVCQRLKKLGIAFEQFKDCVIFEKEEIKTNSDTVYKVYTPYKNKWLEKFEASGKAVSFYECPLKNLRKFKNPKNIIKKDWYSIIDFKAAPPLLPGGTQAGLKRLENFHIKIDDYKKARDYPAIEGTSLLSVYLRHGAISIRDMLRLAAQHTSEGARTWLSEIIWRDFYQMILDAFPQVEQQAYHPVYEKIKWLGKAEYFNAWCQGQTGFPLIDAAMRCFNATGLMHNRLRMVTASFLCKILLVDWKKGEKYFIQHLLDYDLAANNGGWQWSAGSGTDAQPYFRIFNPYTQSERYDPEGAFIKHWCPELAHLSGKSLHRPELKLAPDYPRPIVIYEDQREKAQLMYAVVKQK